MRRCLFSNLGILASGIEKQSIKHLKNFQIIRHRIHSSRKCFSSSTSLLNYMPGFASACEGPVMSPEESLSVRVDNHMNNHEYEQAVLALRASETRLTPPQLLQIIQRLTHTRKYTHLKAVYSLYRPEILKHAGLLVTMIDSTYLERDYQLFEILFDHYMQTQYLTSYYFNMALKVFLRTNPQLSKQILYQMICLQYPIDHDTIYEFLRVADRVSIFDTIKFVVELIKRNPNVPIDDRAYGFLVECYLKNATGLEFDELMEYLVTINANGLFEVKISIFLNKIKDLDIDLAWGEFHTFKQGTIFTKDKLQRLYEGFYQKFSKRMNWSDMQLYLENYHKDGLKDSKELQKNLISHADDEAVLLKYLSDLKANNNIDFHHIIDSWKKLVYFRPDFAYEITQKYQQLLHQNVKSNDWIENASSQIKIVKNSTSRAKQYRIRPKSGETDDLIAELDKCVKNKVDMDVTYKLRALVRDGKKPNIEVLLFALKSLIKMKSDQAQVVYQMIYQLYGDSPVSVELCWLNREMMRLKHLGTGRSSNKVITLLSDFELKFGNALGYKGYNELASHLIDFHGYNLAVGYLTKAKSLVKKTEPWGNISIFVLFLKTLAWKKDLVNFVQLMKVIAKEKDIVVSKYSLKRLGDYRKQIINDEFIDHEAKKVFAQEFDEAYVVLRQRFGEQKETFLQIVDEITAICDEWIRASEVKRK